MPPTSVSSLDLGDTTVRFPHDPATGRLGLELVPTAIQAAELKATVEADFSAQVFLLKQ